MPQLKTSTAIDSLLARGQVALSTAEASKLLGVPADQVRVRMHPLLRTGRAFSPARGFWVAVPPEYRSWGVIPGVQFLDPMMAYLGRNYYVGWLSAAELHGAAHQRPQVLQVAVDRHLSDRDIGRVRLRFIERARLADVPRVRRNVPTGQVWVSTPEATALDLAADPVLGGGVSNVATVLVELGEDGRLDADRLAAAAERYPLAAARRLGFLLDSVGQPALAEALHDHTEQRRRFPPDTLAPGDGGGDVDSRWRLRINTTVEPDL
jgi:predicted transcriptional regulator of viral defense system